MFVVETYSSLFLFLGMETLHPFSHLPISDHRFVVQEMVSLHSSSSGSWTKEENKMFERALAIYAEDSPDRWFKVASMIPGKTVFDVMKQYSKLEEDVFDIEAGRVPIPGYPAASSPLGFDTDMCRKRPSGARGSDQDRKKGVPWTEEEHRLRHSFISTEFFPYKSLFLGSLQRKSSPFFLGFSMLCFLFLAGDSC